MTVFPGQVNKEVLGRYIIRASQDPNERQALKDPVVAGNRFRTNGVPDLPEGFRIVVHEDEMNQTHVILPVQQEVINAVNAAENDESPYLADYVPEPLVDIVVSDDPLRALEFRIGEYTMGRCKT